MALRYRRVKEISRFLPLMFPGDCCQQHRQVAYTMNSFVTPTSSAWKQINKIFINIGCHAHRFSTIVEVSHESSPEVDLLSFIKSKLAEPEGPYHCWLNKGEINKDFSRGDGTFLVLSTNLLDSGITCEKLRIIQQRFPHLFVIGFQSIYSSTGQTRLTQLFMTEYITFPILLSKKMFLETENGVCCILFKKSSSPVFYNDKDLDLGILHKAIEELNVRADGDSTLLNKLSSTSWKPAKFTKEPFRCPSLQNVLLYNPGCISADESGNRLFLSDCNHHRIIISDGNGKILDCIGSSPGFEDGDFEDAKLMRPAASYYRAVEDCLYFVDSENHAIRKAHMGTRILETLYPISGTDKKNVGIWTWIMNKLGLKSNVVSNVDEKPKEFVSNSLWFPWHLMMSTDDDLLIMDRRFQYLWTMDLASGTIKEVVEGSPKVLEICEPHIKEKVSFLEQIPCDWLQQQKEITISLDKLPYAGLVSSLTMLQNHIFICDIVGQRILKVCRDSRVSSNFQFSDFGILGLPYWLTSPLETIYATNGGLWEAQIDHLQHFRLLPGRIDMQLNIDIPVDTELVEPLQEACIWRQARGAASEVSVIEDAAGSLDKVGVAQQWYDELDNLASSTPESELSTKHEQTKDSDLQDERIHFNCVANTSPGTSEVIIYTVLYLRLRRDPNLQQDRQEKYAARIVDILNSRRCGKIERDLWIALLLKSDRDLSDLIFMKPLHIRIKLDCLDHPKADNSRDYILTDSSIEVKISLDS